MASMVCVNYAAFMKRNVLQPKKQTGVRTAQKDVGNISLTEKKTYRSMCFTQLYFYKNCTHLYTYACKCLH